MVKICFTASSGGHTTELLQLTPFLAQYPAIFIGEASQVKGHFQARYTLKQVNRQSFKSLLDFVLSFPRVWRILAKEKPTHIVSTGAMCTLPVCLLGKIKKIKIIYIESFARMEDLSLTGKLVYHFADLFIVQWETLAEKYEKAVYGGGLF